MGGYALVPKMVDEGVAVYGFKRLACTGSNTQGSTAQCATYKKSYCVKVPKGDLKKANLIRQGENKGLRISDWEDWLKQAKKHVSSNGEIDSGYECTGNNMQQAQIAIMAA